MKSFNRFLLLVIILLLGFSDAGIQPVYADDELQVGTYKGTLNLAIHSRANQEIQGSSGGATISWIGEGDVDLTITGAKQGTMIVSYIPVDIFDFGYITLGGCYASVGIKARGSFSGGTAGLNFDPQQKTGTLYLIWNGLDSINIVWDTVQGCWSKKMSEPQITAISETSPTIGQITLTVTKIEDDFISGDCRLPGWEGSGSIPHGTYAHIIDSCYWWAFKDSSQENGGKEWKNK